MVPFNFGWVEIPLRHRKSQLFKLAYLRPAF